MSGALQWRRNRTYLMPIGGGPVRESLIRVMGNLRCVDSPLILLIAASRADGQRLCRQMLTPTGLSGQVCTPDDIACDDPSTLATIEAADIVFVDGGAGTGVARTAPGSRFEEVLLYRLSRGIVVAGTGKGASLMGRAMFCSGDSLAALRYGGAYPDEVNPQKERASPPPAPVIEGLGLMPNLIIERHFFDRNRFGRLAYLITRHREQQVIGLGLDDSTAAVIDWQDEQFAVFGDGNATVMLGARFAPDTAEEPGTLTTFGLQVDLLGEGYGYDIGRGRPLARGEVANLADIVRS